MRRRPASFVNTPNSTAVSRTLECQKPKAVCRIDEGSRAAFIRVRFWLMFVMGHNLAYLNEFDNRQGGMVRGSLSCEYTDQCIYSIHWKCSALFFCNLKSDFNFCVT